MASSINSSVPATDLGESIAPSHTSNNDLVIAPNGSEVDNQADGPTQNNVEATLELESVSEIKLAGYSKKKPKSKAPSRDEDEVLENYASHMTLKTATCPPEWDDMVPYAKSSNEKTRRNATVDIAQ
jgi:hypothetical protein